MPTAKVRRLFAAIYGPKQVGQFITLCTAIATKMAAGAAYANPPVAYATVLQHITDLGKAEHIALGGAKGTAEDRNVKLCVVRTDIRLLKEFVQSLCDANLTQAATLIEGSGMSVSKRAQRTKDPFAVKFAKVPGVAKLVAKSIGRGTYYWQMSVGPDPKTWTSLPDTNKASTTVDGLTTGTLYAFRFRTLSKDGLSDWSLVITIQAR